jgi:hypothetical protein
MPLSALPPGHYPLIEDYIASGGKARFMQVEVSMTASRAA